jgi:2,3-diketo-5-methylthio-1-phosphopentane phosphatase
MNAAPEIAANFNSGLLMNRITPIVFSDFDGTITQVDVTDAILTRLADPGWMKVEEEWIRGEIGSRECLARQMGLVAASRAELDQVIDQIEVDPGFFNFYRFLKRRRIPFYVVSDGFDYVIRRVLRRAGINGALRNGSRLFSSSLKVGRRPLVTYFTHPSAGCEHGCATCKPWIIRQFAAGHAPVIFIGDGLSDRFAIEQADVVFAKDRLLEFCRDRGIECHAFERFSQIEPMLTGLLGTANGRNSGADPQEDCLAQVASGDSV